MLPVTPPQPSISLRPFIAYQLFKENSAELYKDLPQICEQYARCGYLPGIVQLATDVAAKRDPNGMPVCACADPWVGATPRKPTFHALLKGLFHEQPCL